MVYSVTFEVLKRETSSKVVGRDRNPKATKMMITIAVKTRKG